MNKKEVQKRVLQNGKLLELSKFSWDENTKTFSSKEHDLVIDFKGINNCTFKTGGSCTFITNNNCTFITGWSCTFDTGSICTFITGGYCTFITGSICTFKTLSDCKFKTGHTCTFKTSYECTFDTNWNCTFKTNSGCIFKTGYGCTFDILYRGYFINNKNNGNYIIRNNNIIIIRNDNKSKIIELNTLQKNKFIEVNIEKEPIIKDIKDIKKVDGYLMVVNTTKKVNDYTIYNAQYINDYFYDKKKQVYVAEKDFLFAHGNTIKEAINDVEFKRLSTLNAKEHIERVKKQDYMTANDYRLITGACQSGTNEWLKENNLNWDDKKSIDEALELTKDAYLGDVLRRLLLEGE